MVTLRSACQCRRLSLIEALQDWLGECPHCGKTIGAPDVPAEFSPSVPRMTQQGNPATDAINPTITSSTEVGEG
jgi:rRNA maturation protein Nop10